MKKINIGDVFYIQTPKGKAYIQYFAENKKITELVRILHGLYIEAPDNIDNFVMQKENFFLFFPLKAAYNKKIITFVGNYSIPENYTKPKYMKVKNVDKDGNIINWHIVDVDTWQIKTINKLSKGHKKLSPWGIWNDTLLIERLVDGWTLDNWI